VACAATPPCVPPKLGTLDPGNGSASRTRTIAVLLKAVCAADHSLCWFAHISDGQHKVAAVDKEKGRAAYIRVGGPNLSATRKVPQFPAEPGTMLRSLDDGTGQSQIKPQLWLPVPGRGRSGPRRPFPHYEDTRRKFPHVALHGSPTEYAMRGVSSPLQARKRSRRIWLDWTQEMAKLLACRPFNELREYANRAKQYFDFVPR
jgi:hypothetical protein